MCKDQFCVKHAKFFSPFLTNARKNIKPEFLLLDIVLIVKTFGGEVGGFGGGEASPRTPQYIDETLQVILAPILILLYVCPSVCNACIIYIHDIHEL